MFLAHDQWSPRFEQHFFTIQIVAAESHTSEPASSIPQLINSPAYLGRKSASVRSSIPGKSNHPAYYYKIQVSMGRDRIVVYRRYSQFQWLYEQLAPRFAVRTPLNNTGNNPALDDLPLVMPPKSCFCHVQDDRFARNRMEQLEEFLEDVLQRPNVASHAAVAAFLELP